MNLNVKLSKKLGREAGGQPKIWWSHSPPRSSLRTATAYTLVAEVSKCKQNRTISGMITANENLS